MKKSTQNKTEVIQFRLDAKVKKLAREIAGKYFGGNMSDMFRYSLYHFSYNDNGGTDISNGKGRNFTHVSTEDAKVLARISSSYERTRKEISAIGNNTNQVAHHVNAHAISHPTSPLTREAVDSLKEIAFSLKSVRTNTANTYKVIKHYFTKNTNADNNDI